MKTFFKDFRAFIAKGNIIDLAVAFIIGGAFNAIVKSLVNDIIMPVISLLFKAEMSNLFWVLRGSVEFVDGSWVPTEGTILMTYGNFLSQVVNFLIIALSIFVAIRFVSRMQERIDLVKKKLNPDPDEENQENISK
jgi:large conductance mechanosensitive channel